TRAVGEGPRVRGEGARAGEGRARVDRAVEEMRFGCDPVDRGRLAAKSEQRLAERRLLDLEAVPARALAGDGGPPRLRVADDEDAAVTGSCAREGASDRRLVRPVVDRA